MNNILEKIIIVLIVACPVLAALFFTTITRSVFDLPKITIIYILILFILGIWMFSGKLLKASPFNLPIIAYLGISIIATITAISPYVSIFGFYKRYDSILSLISYIILFYAIITFIKKSYIEHILDIIIGTAILACIYGYLQSWGYDFAKWNLDFGLGIRPQSTFGHPGFFACFLAMVIPIVIYKIYKSLYSYIYLIILGLIVYMIFETKTRSSLVALAVFAIIYLVTLIYNGMWRSHITAIILAIVIGISVYQNVFVEHTAVSRFKEDIVKVIKQEDVSHVGSTRIKIWQTGIKIIKRFPVTGIGPDNIAFAYEPFFEDEKKLGFQYQSRLHNDILEQAATRGIPGVLIWFWLMVAIGRRAMRDIRKPTPADDRLLMIMLSSVLLVYLVNNQFSFGTIGTTTTFWFVLGLLIVVCRNCDRYNIYLTRIPLIKVGISLILVLSVFMSFKIFYADVYFRGYAMFKHLEEKAEDDGLRRELSKKSYDLLMGALTHNPHEPVYMKRFQIHFLEQLYLQQMKEK